MQLELFFDGECPLCSREVAVLRRLDRHGRIRFTDIAASDFRAEAIGRTQAELMARIHGRLPDGTWIEGVDVFRQVYAAIGLGALATISRWPGIAQLADGAYRLFAKNRLALTGRRGAACDAGTCTVDDPARAGR